MLRSWCRSFVSGEGLLRGWEWSSSVKTVLRSPPKIICDEVVCARCNIFFKKCSIFRRMGETSSLSFAHDGQYIEIMRVGRVVFNHVDMTYPSRDVGGVARGAKEGGKIMATPDPRSRSGSCEEAT